MFFKKRNIKQKHTVKVKPLGVFLSSFSDSLLRQVKAGQRTRIQAAPRKTGRQMVFLSGFHRDHFDGNFRVDVKTNLDLYLRFTESFDGFGQEDLFFIKLDVHLRQFGADVGARYGAEKTFVYAGQLFDNNDQTGIS